MEARNAATRAVLLIPGVGGHPAFHHDLVVGLGRSHEVHTAPHVDFHDAPCARWDRHVDHWAEQFEQFAATSQGPPAVVGISFGAHVAHALRRRLPRGCVQSLTLVSYRHLPGIERAVLRALPRAPRASAFVVGTVLLRLSDVQTPDRARLHALRRELYDDERLVHRRLAARLASLADAPSPPDPARDGATTFVLGDGERLLRRRHSRAGCTPVLVRGGHSVSVRGSPDLVRVVDTAIGGERVERA